MAVTMTRVLIVEDEFQVLLLAEGILQEAGYEMLTASDKAARLRTGASFFSR